MKCPKCKFTEWWMYLDWSFMKTTFNKLSDVELKNRILNEGYWSYGKGIFDTPKQQ